MDQTDASPASGGSLLTRKYGPLPVWAWASIGLGLLVIVLYMRGSTAPGDAPSSDAPGDEVGGDGRTGPIFILPPVNTPTVVVTPPATPVTAPPGGGRPGSPSTAPANGRPAPPPGSVTNIGPSGRPVGAPAAIPAATSTTVTPRPATPADLARIVSARRAVR